MKAHHFSFVVLFVSLLLMSSCSTTKKISYFQDLQDPDITDTTTPADSAIAPEIRLRPEDKISIIVNSRDPELSSLFNLPYNTRTIGQTTEGTSSGNQGISGYIVKGDGTIDFPVLGTISVAGLTREELTLLIKNELINRDLVKDPVVTVEFINLKFSVMGEVSLPGTYHIDRDRLTLLDAISVAGDLTINGKRDNVLVLRPDTLGNLAAYYIDLRSIQDVQQSPVYYIHQNDYIYVEPNKKRANESTVNGNTVRSATFWMSLVSFITSITTTLTVLFH